MVGIIGVLMAIERLIALTIVGAKVNRQRNNPGFGPAKTTRSVAW